MSGESEPTKTVTSAAMAAKNATANMARYARTLRLAACGRVLAKGRAMQASGQWVSAGGDDAFACWQHSLNADELLPETFDLSVNYVDTLPNQIAGTPPPVGTVLMSHGSPGSYNDFKYIVPLLTDKNIRAIVPSFPGHGLSNTPAAFRHSNDERAEFLTDLLGGVGLNRVDVIVGHSAGCYPLVKLGGDDQYWIPNGACCRTLLLVNPGGLLTPHRSIRPYWLPRLAARLHYTRLKGLVGWSQSMVWNYLFGLRASAEAAMAGTDMIANVGFSQMPSLLQRLATNPAAPRVLLLYSEDDPLIEKERSEETAVALGVDFGKIFRASEAGDVNAAVEHVRQWSSATNGPKHAAVAFGKGLGGHYLQKHQAAFIASCLEILVTRE